MICLESYINSKIELNYMQRRLEMIKQMELTLKEEKRNIFNLINYYSNTIRNIEQDLQNLSGIENKLYKEIIVNNLNVSKAIKKVAFEENKDVSTLWKNYYPNVKKTIEALKNNTSSFKIY